MALLTAWQSFLSKVSTIVLAAVSVVFAERSLPRTHFAALSASQVASRPNPFVKVWGDYLLLETVATVSKFILGNSHR